MSIPPPPRLWQALSPDEKIARLKISFIHDFITLDEFETSIDKVLKESSESHTNIV